MAYDNVNIEQSDRREIGRKVQGSARAAGVKLHRAKNKGPLSRQLVQHHHMQDVVLGHVYASCSYAACGAQG